MSNEKKGGPGKTSIGLSGELGRGPFEGVGVGLRALEGIGLASTIGNMLVMPEIKGTWFNGKDVQIDGYKFIACRFDNCKLHVSSTNFIFEECFIDLNTIVTFKGEILKPIKLFNRFNDFIYVKNPVFAPVKNPNGTISIN